MLLSLITNKTFHYYSESGYSIATVYHTEEGIKHTLCGSHPTQIQLLIAIVKHNFIAACFISIELCIVADYHEQRGQLYI